MSEISPQSEPEDELPEYRLEENKRRDEPKPQMTGFHIGLIILAAILSGIGAILLILISMCGSAHPGL
jgi:hypothetical protein